MPVDKSMHFTYWDQIRKGKAQVEVAQMYGVSRQAVSKSVKAQNHKVMSRLLELARSISALVEWQDETRGVLVGIIPQLEDRVCIILIDPHNKDRVFYKQIREGEVEKIHELIHILEAALGLSLKDTASFDDIINLLVNS